MHCKSQPGKQERIGTSLYRIMVRLPDRVSSELLLVPLCTHSKNMALGMLLSLTTSRQSKSPDVTSSWTDRLDCWL